MNTQADTEGFDDMADEEVFTRLRHSVAGATLATSAAEVAALGRRTRDRHRAVAAGIGTSAAALVAAVGVLAPSAGTGSAQNAAGQGSKVSPVTLNVQDAGFSVQKRADGVVDVTVADVFDPAKLKAALDAAGVKSVIQRADLPRDWPTTTAPDCAWTPGVYRDDTVMSDSAVNQPGAAHAEAGSAGHPVVLNGHPGVLFELHLDRFPAADVVSLVQFGYAGSGKYYTSFLGVLTGMPDKCVPVPAGSPQAMGSHF